jgi:hypothetical protein
MLSKFRGALDIVKSSVFVFVIAVVVPVVLFGHLTAVLTGWPAFLA